MEKTIQGSLGAASAFQLTEEMEVSGGRTNTKIDGDATEFAELNEKTSRFDIAFRAKNPRLSGGEVVVNLYIDVEPQKNYRPGYPIEKRGIYYLSRRLCSQLDVLTEKTDYNQLEKCYSIWICCERIPKEEQMSVSFYKMVNYKNTGNAHPNETDYDLMTLVVIRLGDKDYQSEEKSLLEFLTVIFHPHGRGFRQKLSRYISFEEELGRKEERHMIGLGESIYEEGIETGIKKGIEQGIELNLLLLVSKKLAKGKTMTEIAEALEEPENKILALCEKAALYAPEYDEEKIKEDWRRIHS